MSFVGRVTVGMGLIILIATSHAQGQFETRRQSSPSATPPESLSIPADAYPDSSLSAGSLLQSNNPWQVNASTDYEESTPTVLPPISEQIHQEEFFETLPENYEDLYAEEAEYVDTSKPGVFQKIDFSGTWIAGNNTNDVGFTEVSLFAVFGLPAPTRDSPLLITPGFEVTFLDGPNTVDLPARLFDTYLQFRWLSKLSDRWGADIAVSPGIYSDFQQIGDEALRITGHGFASYDWSETLRLVLGIAYLDRNDVSLLPAAGFIWTPHEDVRFELVLPRPRVAFRPIYTGDSEDWIYVAGEFGGGSWEIERTSGAIDQLTIRDYRAILGWERKHTGGHATRVEFAWVFGREFEFESATPDFDADSTVMIRGGVTY